MSAARDLRTLGKFATVARWPEGQSIVRALDVGSAVAINQGDRVFPLFEFEYENRAILLGRDGWTPLGILDLPVPPMGDPQDEIVVSVGDRLDLVFPGIRSVGFRIAGLWASLGFPAQLENTLASLGAPLDEAEMADRLARKLSVVGTSEDPEREKERTRGWPGVARKIGWGPLCWIDAAAVMTRGWGAGGLLVEIDHGRWFVATFSRETCRIEGKLTGLTGESSASDPLPALRQAGIIVDDLRAWVDEHGVRPELRASDEIAALAGVLPEWMVARPEDLEAD